MRLLGWASGALIALTVITLGCSSELAFEGTVLDPAEQAPSFELSDQFGDQVALSDFAGKVVLLTFLYTTCPDVCPIVTETLRRAHELLGEDSGDVQIVAVSVDPGGDSVERAYEYSQEKEMLDKWHFLTGSEEELRPIWRSYWLDPVSTNAARGGHETDEDRLSDGTESEAPPPLGGYLISHGAPVFLIDAQGKRRVLFTNLSLLPRSLVHDVRLLLR